jgi:hypothetical protein
MLMLYMISAFTAEEARERIFSEAGAGLNNKRATFQQFANRRSSVLEKRRNSVLENRRQSLLGQQGGMRPSSAGVPYQRPRSGQVQFNDPVRIPFFLS